MAQPPAPLAFFHSRVSCLFVTCITLSVWFALIDAAGAQVVWTGLTKTFTKLAGADPTLPANQDPLTAGVVFTRGAAGGLINIAAEQSYTSMVSPMGTQWATDLNNPTQTIAATNWQNLAFTNWINAFGGEGSGGALIANRPSVARLVSANIYLDLMFTSWTPRVGNGFVYMRAEPPVVPTGDYNGDHEVNAADYVVWRDTLTQMVTPPGSGADGDESGTIDEGDYTFWKSKFGNAVPAASASITLAAVPEPNAALLVLISLCSVTLYSGNRSR